MKNEIKTSLWSIAVMTAMTAPFELLVESGKTKIYWDLNEHGGKLYAFVIAPIMFVSVFGYLYLLDTSRIAP